MHNAIATFYPLMALIIDTETNGLPDMANLRWGEYPDFKDLEKYSTSRIVQFTIMTCDADFTEVELKDYIIKRNNFAIRNTEFHGITDEISDKDGRDLIEVAEIFYECLKATSHIIAHNIAFDINVIKSELFRHGLFHIIEEVDRKICLCTMKHMKPILKIINKYGRYKNPSLNELYRHNFGVDIENAHNSKYDVINLHRVIKHMYDNDSLKYSLKPAKHIYETQIKSDCQTADVP